MSSADGPTTVVLPNGLVLETENTPTGVWVIADPRSRRVWSSGKGWVASAKGGSDCPDGWMSLENARELGARLSPPPSPVLVRDRHNTCHSCKRYAAGCEIEQAVRATENAQSVLVTIDVCRSYDAID